MNAIKTLLIAAVLFGFTNGYAQSDWYGGDMSNSEINLEIKKTLNPTRILYIAAHPDDENTRLISWLVNELHAEVAYLSLTNGSGGQNLISEHIGPALGAIREQELYAARRTDGGSQYFTSALDFGYSKSHEETFATWGKQKILAEVVYRIRAYQPDIIITRFSPGTQGLRRTHGHHTASAILAVEAFQAASDPNRFPEQLNEVSAWETDAIYWNTSWWSYGGQEVLDSTVEANPEQYVKINVDAFVPQLGQTTSEIAAASRSMHKSQGFGSASRYGEQFEYLQLLRGKAAARDKLSPFHVHLSSYSHSYLKQAMQAEYKSDLILKGLDRGFKDGKLNQEQVERLKQLWLKSLGLRAFVSTPTPLVQAGELALEVEVVHYGDTVSQLMDLKNADENIAVDQELKKGQAYKETHRLVFNEQGAARVKLVISGVELDLPVVYRSSDPVIGEIIQPTQVVNHAMVHVVNPEIKLVNGIAEKVKIEVTPSVPIKHMIIYCTDLFEYSFADSVDLKPQQTYTFEFEAPANSCGIEVFLNGKFTQTVDIQQIKHDHLPWTYLSKPMGLHIHKTNFKLDAKRVAYIMGAGDKMPDAMRSMGLIVDLLNYATVSAESLSTYDAVVFGIRALNVHEDIDLHMQKFYDYAEAGGNLIMQYNTSHRLKTQQIGPEGHRLTLSRGRVTQEDAPVECVQKHKVLQSPNKMEDGQWDKWVQERGLYFPSDWTISYAAPLAMNDEGEEPLHGSLLIMEHGDGHFVYTGLSFFRELPAGVDGAYKLWANILSL